MSPLERRVTQAVGKVQPGAAVNLGVIMQIMSMVLQFIQQCPFGNAKRSLREGALEAKVAAYRAVKSSGYEGNAVDLANALVEQGRQATDDELESTIASAHSLPKLKQTLGALLLAWLLPCVSATAGPFPGRAPVEAESGPFPLATADAGVGDQRSEVGSRISQESKRPAGGTSPGELLLLDSRIRESDRRSLRDRIADYRAGGGGTVGVRGMTIETHLRRDHGWRPSQLEGLCADELYLLHGMQHGGRIDPRDAGSDAAGGGGDGYAVRQSGRTAYWTVDGVRWSNLGAGAPVEGRVYQGGGRSFVYRDGKMHAVRGAEPARNCAGGRCRLR